MVGVRLTVRSILAKCLQHLLIQSEDHDVWPNVEFIAASLCVRLVRYASKPAHAMLRAISVDFDARATSFAEFATGRMTASWEAMQTAETAVFGARADEPLQQIYLDLENPNIRTAQLLSRYARRGRCGPAAQIHLERAHDSRHRFD